MDGSTDPVTLATRFCDFYSGKMSYDLFSEGPLDEYKSAIQSELERRGYLVTWSKANSSLWWSRPEGFLSRLAFHDELWMWRRTYFQFLRDPDAARPYGLTATTAQFGEAVQLLNSEIARVETVDPDDFTDYQERKRDVERQLNMILQS